MSIRLLLNGHNFSQTSQVIGDSSVPEAGNVIISFDTPKTVLVPAYLAANGAEEAYLRFNGMGLSEEERVVVSGKQDDIVALMAIDGRIIDLVEDTFASWEYTSPLLAIANGAKRVVNIFLTTENVYLAVWDKGLRFAEVLPDPSADSVLYCLQVLGREFKLRKFDILVSGDGASDVVKELAGYFKHVKQL